MKHILFVILVVFGFTLLLDLNEISAAGLNLPIGGRIISNAVPGVICTSIYGGPFTIYPVTKSPPTFYIVSPTAKVYMNYVLRPGSWFKGFYSPIPDLSTCHTTTVPSGPFPVFKITLFGSSR